jgi:hypothetical protein
MDEQFAAIMKVDEQLVAQQSYVHVLKAGYLSAIDSLSLAEMQKLKSVKIYPLDDSSHFIHITHKQEVQKLLRQLKSNA